MPQGSKRRRTFFLTDVEGSASRMELDPSANIRDLMRHDEIIENLAEQWHGEVVRPRGEGDSRFLTFSEPRDAVYCAADFQQALSQELWQVPKPLKVRVAIHAGEAEYLGSDYYGLDPDRCARIRGLAHGGQVLLSSATASSVENALPATLSLRDLKRHELKGLKKLENIFQLVGEGFESTFPPLIVSESDEQKDRRDVIEGVRSTRVEQILDASTASKAPIELRCDDRPDLLHPDQPWGIDLRGPGMQNLPLTPRAMLEIFDSCDGRLLILGEAGSGKTCMLLTILKALVSRAQWDKSQAVPLVFNLCTWKRTSQDIALWLVEEAERHYRMPRSRTQAWLDQNKIVPLLDGLDELEPENRSACIQAINDFQDAFKLKSLAVCSRTSVYHSLTQRLKLERAIEISPLTPEQVSNYFVTRNVEVAKPSPPKVDTSVQSLLSSPLMVNLFIEIQKDQVDSEKELAPTTRADDAEHSLLTELYDRFVPLMLSRPHDYRVYDHDSTKSNAPPPRYKPPNFADSIRYLTWLASWLKANNLEIFYFEELQPDVLPPKRQREYIVMLVLIMATCIGLAVSIGTYEATAVVVWVTAAAVTLLIDGEIARTGLVGVLRRKGKIALATASLFGFSAVLNISLRLFLDNSLLDSLVIGLVFGISVFTVTLIIGFLLLVLSALLFRHPCGTGLYDRRSSISHTGILTLIFVGSTAFAGFSVSRMIFGGESIREVLLDSASLLLSTMLCASLVIGKGFRIDPVERVQLLTVSAILRTSFVVGLFAAAVALEVKTFDALGIAFAGSATLGVAGLRHVQSRMKPGEGFAISARNGLIGGVLGGIVGVIALYIAVNLIGVQDMRTAVEVAVFSALLAALRVGLWPCLQHIVLRTLLIRETGLPLKAASFLSFVSRRSLLEESGGGFKFNNAMLVDYLVTQQGQSDKMLT